MVTQVFGIRERERKGQPGVYMTLSQNETQHNEKRVMGTPVALGVCCVTLCLISLRQVLSLNLKLGWHPRSPSNAPASTPNFDMCSGILTQTLLLARQALSPTEPQ